MSFSAVKALLKAAQNGPRWQSPAQFAVLMVIADATHEDGKPERGIPAGYAWTSKATIARRIKCSSRYVPKVTGELEALDLIERRRAAGPRGANLYRLTGAVQFTPNADATSAVQFTPSESGPVNDTQRPVNDTTSGDELQSIPPVPCSSPELLRDPLSELLSERTTAAAPRSSLAKAPNPNGNYQVVAKVARELLAEQTFEDEADLVEATKSACAAKGIEYQADVRGACCSEWFKHHNIAQRANA